MHEIIVFILLQGGMQKSGTTKPLIVHLWMGRDALSSSKGREAAQSVTGSHTGLR